MIIIDFEEILFQHFERYRFLFGQYVPLVTLDLQIQGDPMVNDLSEELLHIIFQVICSIFPEYIRTNLDIDLI